MRYVKYGTARQPTYDNMVHGLYLPDNYGHTQTHAHTHSEYVILIGFPRREHASLLRYVLWYLQQ
jgi:hypothetical protein